MNSKDYIYNNMYNKYNEFISSLLKWEESVVNKINDVTRTSLFSMLYIMYIDTNGDRKQLGMCSA